MTKRRRRRPAHPAARAEPASYVCPACYESVDTFPDPGGGPVQTVVEDCPVCCRPNVLRLSWDGDAWRVEAARES